MGSQSEKRASCTEPLHLLVTVTSFGVNLFWCTVTMIGQLPPGVFLKFPAPWCIRGCSGRGRWKRSFITAAKQCRVLMLRKEILARRKNTAIFCLAHNLGKRWCPIWYIYTDRHTQICSACTPSWRGTSQLQSRPRWFCAVLHSILPKCSIARILAVTTAPVHIDIRCQLHLSMYVYSPEPSLKASKDEGNLSSKLSCLCLTRLSGWEGGKGGVSQYVCKL